MVCGRASRQGGCGRQGSVAGRGGLAGREAGRQGLWPARGLGVASWGRRLDEARAGDGLELGWLARQEGEQAGQGLKLWERGGSREEEKGVGVWAESARERTRDRDR